MDWPWVAHDGAMFRRKGQLWTKHSKIRSRRGAYSTAGSPSDEPPTSVPATGEHRPLHLLAAWSPHVNQGLTPTSMPNLQHLRQQALGLSTRPPEESMARVLERGQLSAASDGAYDPDKEIGSFGWVLDDGRSVVAWQGSGRIDSGTSPRSPVRSELAGLNAALLAIEHIAITHTKQTGLLRKKPF